MQTVGYECRVMGVPKTIDNDLFGTDHCPGFGSAAKYIATSMMEVNLDAHVYDTGMIAVMEIMGRHAGWLAASAALASEYGAGPDSDLSARSGLRACPSSLRMSSVYTAEKRQLHRGCVRGYPLCGRRLCV